MLVACQKEVQKWPINCRILLHLMSLNKRMRGIMPNKKVTFSQYDSANYLRDEQDAKAYLEAALEDGDPTVIATALANVDRANAMSGQL